MFKLWFGVNGALVVVCMLWVCNFDVVVKTLRNLSFMVVRVSLDHAASGFALNCLFRMQSIKFFDFSSFETFVKPPFAHELFSLVYRSSYPLLSW